MALPGFLAHVSAAPLGSISSMEVNVDMLEQMDMMDLSDQDTMDVFLSCGTEDNNVAGLLPGTYTTLPVSSLLSPQPSRQLVSSSIQSKPCCDSLQS